MLVSIVVMPLAIIKILYKYWILGNFMCATWIFFDVLLCTASILLLCAISCERYIGIKDPLKHREKSKTKIKLIILSIFALAIFLSSPVLILAYMNSANIIRDGNCSLNNTHYIIYGSIFSLIIPLIIMITMYALTVRRLLKVLKEFKMREKRHGYLFTSNDLANDTETPASKSKTSWKILASVVKQNSIENEALETKLATPAGRQSMLLSKKSIIAGATTIYNELNVPVIDKHQFTPRPNFKLLAQVAKLNSESEKTRASTVVETETTINGKTEIPSTIIEETDDSASKINEVEFPLKSSSEKQLSNPGQNLATRGFNRKRSLLRKIINCQNQNNEGENLLDNDKQQQQKTGTKQQPIQIILTSSIDQDEAKNSSAETSSFKSSKGLEKFKSVVNQQRIMNKAIYAFKIKRESSAVKNEQKAVKVLGFVFVVFLIAWAPFTFVNILSAFLQSSSYYTPSHTLLTVLTWLGYISSSINPLVYTAVNEKFRYAFKQILKCNCYKLSSKQQAALNSRQNNKMIAKIVSQNFLIGTSPRTSHRFSRETSLGACGVGSGSIVTGRMSARSSSIKKKNSSTFLHPANLQIIK